MSNAYITAVWNLTEFKGKKIIPRDKLVMACLADYANNSGECWPSVRTIATRTGYSERQIQRVMKSLEMGGLLTRIEARKGKTDKYRLNVSPRPSGDTVMSPLKNGSGDTAMSPVVVTQLCPGGGDTAMSPEPTRTPKITPKRARVARGGFASRKEARISTADNFTADYTDNGRVWTPDQKTEKEPL